MTLLFQDNFRRYPTPMDMTNQQGFGGQWFTHFGNMDQYIAVFLEADSALKKTRKDRVLGVKTTANGSSPMAQFDGVSHPAVCFSFIIGAPGYSYIPMDFVIFDTPVVPLGTGTVSSSGVGSYQGIHLKCTSAGDFTVRHKIVTTASTGVGNDLILATLPSLKSGTLYHIEGKVDHSGPVARIILYVNGFLVLDMTYDRDRVDNGMQDKAFRHIILSGDSASYEARYRDLVIYTDDATTTFPMGPISFPTKDPTAHPGMVIDVWASDATNVTIAPGAEVTGTFSELEASGQPILGAYVEMRHLASGGLLKSEVDLEVLDAADNVIKTVYSVTPPGLMGSQPKARLNGLTAAQAAGLKYRIRARR